MTKQILSLLFCIWTTLAFAQTNNLPCHDLDFIVSNTIESLNKRDIDFYRSLIEYDFILKMCDETAKDSTEKGLCDTLKMQRESFMNACVLSFIELTGRIDTKLITNKWSIKLHDYITYYEQKEPDYSNFTLHVNVEINMAKYHLTVDAIKYKDCYHLCEPVMPYLHKGWDEKP